MLKMTSAMTLIPYFLVVAYGFLIANRGETYDRRPEERTRDLGIAGLAALYTAFMLSAGGMKFILLSTVLYAPGTMLTSGRGERRTSKSSPSWTGSSSSSRSSAASWASI